MKAVFDAIGRYRSHGPSPQSYADNPFRLASTIDDPTPRNELDEAAASLRLPDELTSLWSCMRSGRLFADVDYGQWGLVVLSPPESINRTSVEVKDRPDDFQPGDLVFGEFLGDQDLLVYAPSEPGDRRILVALPLDERASWPGVASTVAEFLNRFFDAKGRKYWED